MRWLRRWFRQRSAQRERAAQIVQALEVAANEFPGTLMPREIYEAGVRMQHRLEVTGHYLALTEACRLVELQWEQQYQQRWQRRRRLILIK